MIREKKMVNGYTNVLNFEFFPSLPQKEWEIFSKSTY